VWSTIIFRSTLEHYLSICLRPLTANFPHRTKQSLSSFQSRPPLSFSLPALPHSLYVSLFLHPSLILTLSHSLPLRFSSLTTLPYTAYSFRLCLCRMYNRPFLGDFSKIIKWVPRKMTMVSLHRDPANKIEISENDQCNRLQDVFADWIAYGQFYIFI